MAALRNKAIKILRNNCPEALRAPLEILLADTSALDIVQSFLASNIKTPGNITLESLLALPFSEPTKQLISGTPDLVDYLKETAMSLIPH